MSDVTQIRPQARIVLQKNTGVILYSQQFAPNAATYTSHVAQAVSIATNTSVALNQGNIAAARNIILQVDQPCTLLVNGNAVGIPLVGSSAVYAAYSTSITAIKIDNSNTTNVVNVTYALSN